MVIDTWLWAGNNYKTSQVIGLIVYATQTATNVCNDNWLLYYICFFWSSSSIIYCQKKGRRRRRRRKRSFLSIHFKFQGDPILGLDAVFCSHNVSSPSENFWHGIPMSALLWVSISLVEQKLGESPPYVSSKAICRSLMVCSRICSVFVGWKSIHVAAGSQGVHHEYPMPSTCAHHLEPLSTGIVCYSHSCEVWKSQTGSWRPVFSTGLAGSGYTSRETADRSTCWLTSPW